MEYETVGDVTVPALGFGTARMDDYDEQRRAMDAALAAGYRHIDTAQSYGSERAVGDAIADADLDREECFITTKLAGDNRTHERVIASTEESLDRLSTDYLDLLLIHFPNDEVSHEETLAAMNELQEDGLVRHLGVSNFSVDQCEEAVERSDAPILTNQVKYHARNRQDTLLKWCIDHDVLLTAYSPIGVGELIANPVLEEIGEAHDKTAAQVAIRWLLDQPNVITIPMSSSPEHIRENIDVFDFELSGDERMRIFDLEGEVDGELASTLSR